MFARREVSRVAKNEAVMGLRLMCLVIAGCLLGCGGARTTNAGTAPATQVRSPEEQQALLAFHLGLLAQRIDTHCPEHALDAVLNAGAAPTLPRCDVNMDVEDVALKLSGLVVNLGLAACVAVGPGPQTPTEHRFPGRVRVWRRVADRAWPRRALPRRT